MKRPSYRALAEKAIRLRQAALMCWLLGWVATATAVYQGLSNTFAFEWFYIVPVAFVSSFFLQRVFTSMESGLTSGELPVPWKVGWTGQVCLPWLLALVVLFVDVLLNISAAYTILNNADVGGQALGMAEAQENGVRSGILVIVAVVIALGSEILRSWADMIDPSMQDEAEQQLDEKVRQQHRQHSARPAQENSQQLTKAQRRALAQQQHHMRIDEEKEQDGSTQEEDQQPRGPRRPLFRSRSQRQESSKG